tara:strand:- start:7199 stop:8299 length:1101 start_codon:yes stop_codon:yes gene_type:complete
MAYTTIDDPSAYFQTATWTGDGSSPRTITNDGNSNLQPDWIWHKNRSDSGRSHYIHDSSRGFGAHHELVPNSNTSENSDSHLTNNHGYIASASTDSFVLGAGATNDNYTNKSSSTYVAWQWKANGGTTSTNTAGTNIDTTVQANTTAGFSIMTYTGTGTNNDSIGHGLGAVPHWIIVKNRDETNRWTVYHHKNTSSPETEYLNLQDTTATTDVATRWNDTAPTSTVITLGDNDGVSKANTKYVCYAFTEIQGYSKFGSYTGNGNTDGTFVYTGFKPAWLMIKRSDSANSWYILDSTRGSTNPVSAELEANTTGVEATSNVRLDILSNGYKIRTSGAAYNASGGTYVYMAFAEHPFVSSEGVPCTAR